MRWDRNWWQILQKHIATSLLERGGDCLESFGYVRFLATIFNDCVWCISFLGGDATKMEKI